MTEHGHDERASPPLDDVDAPLLAWLARCRELAGARDELDGVESPARELADLAAGNRALMERAYRLLRSAVEHEPGNATLHQMASLWRRAYEKGSWTWEADALDRSPYLTGP